MKIKLQTILPLIAILALLGLTSSAYAQEKPAAEIPAALNFTMKSIEGEDVALSKYAGKVVVLVNVASKCGHTPQYEQLQKLHADFADQGLSLIHI